MAAVESNVPGSQAPASSYAMVEQQEHLPPNNHMFLAWFSCLCCCWPLGLFAIFKACAVHDLFANGDFERANEAAKTARNASLVAIVMGIVLLVVNIIYYGGDTNALLYGEETNS